MFFAGNGGSGGNANHLANDFLYALSKTPGSGLRVHSLSANPSVITCLANDEGYDQVFSLQLAVLARKGDVLIVLSGSGNSPNIVKALEEAKAIGMTSYAMLGFSGGKAKALADVPIHFAIDDMQIAEDAQMIVGHMMMQWLYAQRGDVTHEPRGLTADCDGGARKIPDPRLELVFGRDLCRFSRGRAVMTCSRPAARTSRIDAFLPYKWQERPGSVRFKRDRSQSRSRRAEGAACEPSARPMS